MHFQIENGVLTDYSGDDHTVIVPYGVTEIGKSAFFGAKCHHVTLPAGLKKIGDMAFCECEELWTVDLPYTLESIGTRAFFDCRRLTDVAVPAGVKYIGKEAFGYYSEYSSDYDDVITLYVQGFTMAGAPHSAASDYARRRPCPFRAITDDHDCEEHLDENCRCMICGRVRHDFIDNDDGTFAVSGKVATAYCMRCGYKERYYSDTGTVIDGTSEGAEGIETAKKLCCAQKGHDWDDGICRRCGETRGGEPFRDDTAFRYRGMMRNTHTDEAFEIFNGALIRYRGSDKHLTLPDTVERIGKEAFFGNDSLVSVTIPSSAAVIGDSAFRNCGSLETVVIEDGVEVIGSYAFAACPRLTAVTLPDSLLMLRDAVFYRSDSLESITIPKNVNHISEITFDGCGGLQRIEVSAENPDFDSVDGVLYNKGKQILKCFPNGRSERSFTVPDGVGMIGNFAFAACPYLREVHLPDSVLVIGFKAFSRCANLEKVTFGGRLGIIGEYAFDECECLHAVTVPPSVKRIDKHALGYVGNRTLLGFVIRGAKRSAAERYAKENGMIFEKVKKHEF